MNKSILKARTSGIFVVASMTIICMVFLCLAGVEDTYSITKRPGKPTGVKAKPKTYNSVVITWKEAKNAKSYEVYRSITKNGNYVKISTVRGKKFTNKKLETGRTYWYKVRARNGAKMGSFSKKVKCTPKLKKPKAKATSLSTGARIKVKKVKGASGYIFYRNGHVARIQKGTVFTDKDIKVNKEYNYRVAAYRMIGNKRTLSPKSNKVSALKEQWDIVLKDSNDIPTLRSGKSCSISGRVVSNLKIARIEIGVVNKTNGKWVGGVKYDNKNVNSKKFNISRADSSVSFKSLAPGVYCYRIYAHSPKGTVKILKNQKFSVVGTSGSSKANAAVKWAKKIANDDSFAYGTGAACHRTGCYFCGTNQKKKPKGYEKTYVCLTFVGAAYAHGAKDSEILNACQNGKMTCYANDDNFRVFSCWSRVGYCKDLTISDLKPGDVLINWGTGDNKKGHACMYAGKSGNKYMLVEAATEGWGPDSIRYISGAEKRLAEYGTRKSGVNYKKNYVMRYSY